VRAELRVFVVRGRRGAGGGVRADHFLLGKVLIVAVVVRLLLGVYLGRLLPSANWAARPGRLDVFFPLIII
jgi:hypothetical protein